MELIRVTSTASGRPVESSLSWAMWYPDGRYLVMIHDARDLAGRAPVPDEDEDVEDLFIVDTVTGGLAQVTFNADVSPFGISTRLVTLTADGRTLLFNSDGAQPTPAVPADAGLARDDAFALDFTTGAVARLSQTATEEGTQAADITADGRFVALTTDAWDLPGASAGDQPTEDFGPGIDPGIYGEDVVILDRTTGLFTRVANNAAGAAPDSDSEAVAFSPDGRFLLYESRATDIAGVGGADFYSAIYTPGLGFAPGFWSFFDRDIFLYDRVTGGTVRITTESTGDAVNASADAYGFSPDGRFVLFDTGGGDVRGAAGVDANDTGDAFIYEVATGAVRRISNDGAGNAADDFSVPVAFSSDSRYVLMDSDATNLAGVGGSDGNGTTDVFVVDIVTGLARRISNDAAGNAAAGESQAIAFSPDGRRVLFESQAEGVGGIGGRRYDEDQWDLFVADLDTGAVHRLTTDAAGRPAGAAESNNRVGPAPSFSPDGSKVVFWTGFDGADRPNYAGIPTENGNVFVAELPALPALPINGGPGDDTLTGTAGDDVMTGGGGSDTLLGGGGDDLARLEGGRGQYGVMRRGGETLVGDRATGAVDRLVEVEEIAFADGTTLRPAALSSVSAQEYLAGNPDLLAAFGADAAAAEAHQRQYGLFEGRGGFDGLAYIASHADLMGALGPNEDAGASHYVQYGRFEGRGVSFDPLAYVASYADLAGLADATGAVGEAAALHYISFGRGEGRSVTFDPLQYIASHDDLVAAFGADGSAATRHYLAFGRAEGRSADGFNAARYLRNYDDLDAALGGDEATATLHYILYGYAEGRTDGPLIG